MIHVVQFPFTQALKLFILSLLIMVSISIALSKFFCSRLSYMGLPCPNIFTGMQNIHSKLEWVGVKDMEKAVETLVHLAQVWEERS